jgi:hypothetical protein
VRRDDEDDHSGDAGGTSWVDRIVIPDDISELDAEVRALRRTRRVERRRQRLRRLSGREGTTGPLLLVVLLLVAGFAGLLVLFQPRRTAGTVTTLGSVQAGLLPDVRVRVRGGAPRPIRDFRPGVFALSPIGCNCDAALVDAADAARRHNVSFFLLDRSLPPLPDGLTDATAIRLVDTTDTVTTRYNARREGQRVPGGPVLVLVGAAGEIQRVLPGPTQQTLDSELDVLVPEAAPAS